MMWKRMFGQVIIFTYCFHSTRCEDVQPSFTKVPEESLTVPLLSSVTLRCEAAGSPIPTISWTKNDSDVAPSWIVSPGIIHTQQFGRNDVGRYTCKAVNTLGIISHSSSIAILDEPIFVRPEKTTVKTGSAVSLECQSPSTSTVTWITPNSGNFTVAGVTRDEVKVDVNHTLHIARTTRRHHGLYVCVVTDDVSSLTITAQVNVQSLPVITRPPTSRLILAGERVRFTCAADGYPRPIITWFKDGQSRSLENLIGYTVMEGAVEIKSATQNDEGIYRCIANNTQGSTVAIATLKVIVRPFFSTISGDQVVQIGDDVTLQCQAEGSPVPIQKWERSGQTMIIDDNMQLFPNFTLVISNIRESQLGEYACKATNIGGSNSSTMVLRKGDIYFTVVPVNTHVTVSHDVTVSCQAASINKSTPTISWNKTTADGSSSVLTDNRISIARSGDLTIQKSTLNDEGWYLCSAQNEEGKISAEAVFLDVQFSASIIKTSGPQQVPSGSSASMSCNATGDPTPSTSWRTPTNIVIGPDHSGYQATGGLLTVTSVSVEADTGDWTCEACNTIGCDRTTLTLLVLGAPSIRTVETSQNSSTITVRCVGVGHPAPVITYLVKNKAITGSLAGHRVIKGALYIDSASLTDFYTCTAVNKFGSAEQSLNKPNKSSKPLVTDIKSRNITLEWNRDLTTNIPSRSVLEYRRHDGSTETAWKSVNIDGESTTALATGLEPNTAYVFRVRATNVFGEGPASDVSNMYRTLAEAPSAPVNTTVVVNGRSIQVRWLPPKQINGNIDDIVYKIQLINSSGSLTASLTITNNNPLKAEFNVSENGRFTVVLSAGNTVINEHSKEIRKSVQVINPAPVFVPQIRSLLGISAHEIYLNWTVPTESSVYPPIDGYIVYHRTADKDEEFSKIILHDVSTTQYTIANLEERSAYEISVAAFNAGGHGPLSDTKEAKTKYELFSSAAYTKDFQISGWTAAIIAGSIAILFAILCFLLIVAQHHRMKKQDSVSFVKPSQTLTRFYLENPNTLYSPGGHVTRDGVAAYDSAGDGVNDEYVQFIKARWLRDMRLGTLSSKDGSEVMFSHDNPAFNEDDFYDRVDNQDEFLEDFDTQLHQPRRLNSITDSGVAYDFPSSISEEEHDGNFVLLPKPSQDDRTEDNDDAESATQEVKIDFPEDSSFTSDSSYASEEMHTRARDLENFFKHSQLNSTNIT